MMMKMRPLDLSALDERVGSSEYLTPTPITGGNFTFREQRDPDSGGGEYTDDGPLSLDTVEIYASTDYVPVNGPVSMP
nr:hypothetical protein BaRGS_028584 [Batillaria attramentaria]